MVTVRRKISPASSPARADRRASSSGDAAWAVASRTAPQPAADRTALASSSRASSSKAMTWGVMARRSMGTAIALGQPSSTSVRGPTSSWGLPRYDAASSPRSSTRETRMGGRSSVPRLMSRTRSRRRVVLPPPGGERTRALWSRPASMSRGSTGRATPSRTRGTRMDRELSSRSPSASSPWTDVPHTPTRKPPGAVTYPWLRVPAAVYRENSVARSSTSSKSSAPTCVCARGISPSGRDNPTGRPTRSRSSSTLAIRRRGTARAAARRAGGSRAQASSYRPAAYASVIAITFRFLRLLHCMRARP